MPNHCFTGFQAVHICGDKMSSNLENRTSASVKNAETFEKNKKAVVYKVEVNRGNTSWFIFRRYNEFSKLCEIAKKQVNKFFLYIHCKNGVFPEDCLRVSPEG